MLRDLAGKTVMLGVIDLADLGIESAETVAGRIRAGLKLPAPDCGMKYLPRDVATGKLKALVDGAAIVRRKVS